MIIQTGFDERTVADRRFGDHDQDEGNDSPDSLFEGTRTVISPVNPWESGPVPQMRVDPTPSPETRPRVLGRYVMYEEIARGGMASVHLGRSLENAGMARTVAIKRLHSQLAWNPGFVAMFLDEARITARVKHPNVVAPIDFVVLESQGELCLVMEYVHGETLTHLLAAGFRRSDPPPPAVAVSVMAGVLRGLHAAHEAKTDAGAQLGIVHRDVSPQNIMVGADGVARILDFGVATARVQPSQTADIELKGKPSYLSPEQIRGGAVDRRADVFAAGIVLWEMLARRRLFQHSDPRVVLLKILKGDISPPSHHNPEVPPELDAAVLKALQREPTRRFATARDFALAIEGAFEAATFPEVGDWVRDVAGDVLAKRARRVSELAARDERRLVDEPESLPIFDRRWRRWAVVAGLLAVVGVSAVWSGDASVAGARAAQVAERKEAAPSARPQAPARTVAMAKMSVAPLAAPVQASVPAPAATVPPPEAVAVAAVAAVAPSAPQPAPAVVAAAAPVMAPAPAEEPVPAPKAPPVAGVPAGGLELAAETATDAPIARAPAPKRAVKSAAREPNRRLVVIAAGRKVSAMRSMADLNRRAVAAYENMAFENARRHLRSALEVSAMAGLGDQRVTAETHAYMAVVLVGGYKQRHLGIEAFKKALAIDPTIQVPRRLFTPEIAGAFQEASLAGWSSRPAPGA